MNLSKNNLANILVNNAKISVPIFQREYSWEEERVKTFWLDLLKTSKDDKLTHYMGTMVRSKEATLDGDVSHYLVIDGQQRMTVTMLLAASIREYIKKNKDLNSHILNGVSEKIKLRKQNDLNNRKLHLPGILDDTYIHFQIEEQRYKKFYPTELNKDRTVYNAVVYKAEADKRKRHHRHFELLKDLIHSSFEQADLGVEPEDKIQFLHSILDGLSRMILAYIELDETDDPQQIFESINYKGEPLTVTDLIRNHILTLTEESGRESLFEHIWSPLEDSLCQIRDRNEGVLRKSLFDGFFRAYAGMNGDVVSGKQLYSRLRDLLQNEIQGARDVDAIIHKMEHFSDYALTDQTLMWSDANVSEELSKSVKKFSSLDFITPMSLLMLFYGRSQVNRPDDVTISNVFSILENYYVRRALLGKSVKRMSDFFAHLCVKHKNEKPQALDFPRWLQSKLISETNGDFSNLKPISDNELRTEITRARVYANNKSATRFALCAIEISRSSSNGIINNLEKLDIEHVLPQSHEKTWMDDLQKWNKSTEGFPSEEAKRILWVNDNVDLLRDTLGNLTLTNFNRDLKNYSFLKKRDYTDSKSNEKGYRHTNIRIARDDFGNLEMWNFDMIKERTQKLCDEFISIYPQI